jgi:hypothetical protein
MDPSEFRQKGMMTHHGQAHAPPLHITDITQSWRQPQQPQRDVCTRRGAVHDGFRKGLPEIEQLEREQGLIKGMQALGRFMQTHPDYWNESSSQLLLEVKSYWCLHLLEVRHFIHNSYVTAEP